VVEKYLPLGAHVIQISPNSEDIREYLEMGLKRDWDSETMSPTLRANIMKRILEKIPDERAMASSIPKI